MDLREWTVLYVKHRDIMARKLSGYKELEHKKTAVEGWENAEAARSIIREAQERYKKIISDRLS